MHCKTEGGTLIRRAASGLKSGVLQYWRNRVKILLRKPGKTSTALVQSSEKTLIYSSYTFHSFLCSKVTACICNNPFFHQTLKCSDIETQEKLRKKTFPIVFFMYQTVTTCRKQDCSFIQFFYFSLRFICNRVFISEPVSTWACLQIDQLYNIGEHFYLPSRLDSLTPLISKSASLSMSSIISCVSLQSCSFTVCLRVSSTSSLSSCVRYFMLSVL